jgi:hypothetical protein
MAIALSLAGTIWLILGLWELLDLRLERPETAVFFIIGALPALGIYGAWVLRACNLLTCRKAGPVWVASVVVNLGYFILLKPSSGLSLSRPFEFILAGWLLVAIGLSLQGLLTDRSTASLLADEPAPESPGPAAASPIFRSEA